MAGSFKWQPSFAGGVLGPGLHGRVDLSKYSVGLKTGKNIFIHAHGGFSNRGGTRFVAEVRNSASPVRLIPFERDETTTYVLSFNNGYMRPISRGAQLMLSGAPYEIAVPYTSLQARDLNYVQSIDVMYLAHEEQAPRKLMHYGPTNWAITPLITDPAAPTPGAPTVTSKATGDGKVYSYRVSVVVNGVEGYPGPIGQVTNAQDLRKEGAQNTITIPTVTPTPQEYRVYRLRGGIWGYIGFVSGGAATIMIDDNIEPDIGKSIRQPSGVFASEGNWPGVVAISQQRLIWARSKNRPETIWASVIGNYEDYSRSRILQADDRIEMDISGEKLNRIAGLIGMQELLALTGSGEYGVGANDGTLSATQPRQARYGASGSSGVRPLMVGDSILYVDRSGRLVRDLKYSFEADGYSGNDLSVLANHYFIGRKVIDWAYCHAPYGLVWVVLDDGKVLCLTYKREQEVWAWTEHDFGGPVESVCSVHEDGVDALYLAVRRVDGNGDRRRYIERMCNRVVMGDSMDSCFLDCAVSYEGAKTDTITGLDHLNGLTVTAIADGDVVQNLVVANGQVKLDFSFTKAHVGLPFVSEAETLPLYVELQGTGASRGLPVKATEAFVQVEDTRGIELLTSTVDQAEAMVQTVGNMNAKIPLFTGLWKFDLSPDFNNLGTIKVRQKWPVPMTVLGISPKWVVGR